MRKIKKIISVMLILAMMLTFAPISKAANISENDFANRIEYLKSVYRQGEYWNEYNSCKSNGTGLVKCSGSAEGMSCINRGYCGGSTGVGCTCTCGAYYENGTAMAWQCMGFAHKMGYEVFGDYISSSAWETSYSLGTIYAGDIIRIKNQHSIFVIKVVGETVYYADCNRTGPCQVDWTGSYTKSQIASFFNYKKHHKGNILTGDGTGASTTYDSISTGYYTLTNVGSGKILDVAGGVDADQTNIQGGDWWNPSNQRLYISPVTTGYKMKPVCSSRLINAWGDNPGNGANVNIYKDCNESSQWWLFEKVSDGYVIHLAYNPSLVLTYWASSNNVAIATYASGDTRQIWKLDPSNQFTVSYNASGGTGAPASQSMYQGRESALSSTTPTRSGYTFDGWNTKADGTGTAYAAGATIILNSNVTLYAQWKSDSYTLTYNANGGSGAPSAQTVTKGGTIVIPSTVPTRSGYNFIGWNTKADGTGDFFCEPGDSVVLSKNMTLYAIWETAYYIISYDANGGTVPIDDVLVPSGNTVNLSTPTKYVTITYNANGGKNAPSATKAYYECLGWSNSSTATTATYKCGEQYTVTEDITLYAVWANKAYADLSSVVPTRDGYKFLGWATSSSATSAQFAPGINVNLGIDTPLYAVWQKIETPKPEPTPPTVTYENVSLNYKDSMTFNVPVTLETSNSGVASVSGNKISAVGTGSADVTATFADGSVCVYHINVSYAWWQWIIVIVLFGWIWY